MLIALLFTDQKNPVVVVALKLSSILAGGIVGLYVLGFRRTSQRAALVGFSTSAAVMGAIAAFTPLAWTWYVPAGLAICLSVAGCVTLVSRLWRR